MIEENLPIEKKEAKEYSPIPEDVYHVELLDVNIKEQPKYKEPDVLEKVLDFQFTILAGKDKEGNDLRGRNIWRNFVPTYLYVGKNGKNTLYQIIEAFLKRDMTQEEEASADVKKLNAFIGKQCRVVVENKKKDDKVYSNIAKFLYATEQITPLTDEEKESARVKNEDEKSESIQKQDKPNMEVNVEDIPF